MHFRIGMTLLLFLSTTVASSPARSKSIDPDQLEHMRLSVESYMSRIQHIRIHYTLDWMVDRNSSLFRMANSRVQRYLQNKLAKSTDPAERDIILRTMRNNESDGSLLSFKLIYSFPSIRYDQAILKAVGSDQGPSTLLIRAIDNHRFTYIDFHAKTASIITHISNEQLRLFMQLPTSCVGLRPYPVNVVPENQSLESLLSHPQVTFLEGHELIGGVDTVLLRVGPRIPADHRPGDLGDEGFVKLWLAPSFNHLAIKKEYHLRRPANSSQDTSDPMHSVDLADFRPVSDMARQNMKMVFPFLITYKDLVAKSTFMVSSVTVNGAISPDEFRPDVPAGFNLSMDGSKQRLVGGSPEKHRRVRETVKSAQALLATSPPRQVTYPVLDLRIAGAIVFAVGLAILYFLRRRHRHAF